MKPRKSETAILRRMALQGRPYWPHIVCIFLLSRLSTPLTLLTPLPLKIVIDSVIGSRPLPRFLLPFVPQNAQHSPTLLLAVNGLHGPPDVELFHRRSAVICPWN